MEPEPHRPPAPSISRFLFSKYWTPSDVYFGFSFRLNVSASELHTGRGSWVWKITVVIRLQSAQWTAPSCVWVILPAALTLADLDGGWGHSGTELPTKRAGSKEALPEHRAQDHTLHGMEWGRSDLPQRLSLGRPAFQLAVHRSGDCDQQPVCLQKLVNWHFLSVWAFAEVRLFWKLKTPHYFCKQKYLYTNSYLYRKLKKTTTNIFQGGHCSALSG